MKITTFFAALLIPSSCLVPSNGTVLRSGFQEPEEGASGSGARRQSALSIVDLRPYIHVRDNGSIIIDEAPKIIAVQICVGLMNRNETAFGTAFTVWYDTDLEWLGEFETVSELAFTHSDQFISRCLDTVAMGRYIRYDYDTQQEIVPNLITQAAVLDALLLVESDDTAPLLQNATMVFDAEKEFEGFSPYDATLYMFQHYASQTTTMSKMNPGYNYTEPHTFGPKLVKQPEVRLADYIVKERLFNFFLLKGCIPYTQEHALMTTMTQPGHPNTTQWPQPIAVFGYDDYRIGLIPGDFFEAETICVERHNMGQVATGSMTNMAFWSRRPPITKPLTQNPSPKEVYDSSRTYISFVIGDGDNIGMASTRNYNWVRQRVEYCQNQSMTHNCFPISWTVSPHALYATPDMLEWYYSKGQLTGQDYFVLPPSGYLYAYPSMMQDEDQATFVSRTEQAAQLLNTSGSVDWEYTMTWKNAIRHFFPRYATNNIIRGLFAVNVPFNIPIWQFGRDEFYKVIHGSTVLFRPREWRGASGSSDIPFSGKDYLTEEEMADEINDYPPGTVCYIYLTSDGGADLDSFYNMVPYLDQHVQIVSHETLTDLALQHHKALQQSNLRNTHPRIQKAASLE